MKRLVLSLMLIAVAKVTTVAASPALQDADSAVSGSVGEADNFYGALAPYGEWLELDAGFYAWRPTHVGSDWRPYLHGRWAWTDYGWYWVSSEPFGWATFHYGRWYLDDAYGWVWIPDRTWGPAWVEWRYNDDYLGWAPLPPYASFSFNMGIRFTTHWFAPYRYWNFVRYGSMTSPYIYRSVVPIDYSRRLISTTRSAGRYDFENGHIINRGVSREVVERRGGIAHIDRFDVRDSREMGERFVRDRDTRRIDVFRPEFTRNRMHERFDALRVDRGTSLDLQKIERGRESRSQIMQPGEVDRGRRIFSPESRNFRVPSSERKELELRKENRYPFPGSERTVRTQRGAQRSASIQAPQRGSRQEMIAPPSGIRGFRSSPEVRKENPRRSEQGRRDGSRRKDR